MVANPATGLHSVADFVREANYHRVLGETTWLLYEIWESKADSDAHQQKPDVKAFFAKAPQLLAAEPVIYPLGPVL